MSQIRYETQTPTTTEPTTAARAIRPRPRVSPREEPSASVALLVLQPGSAPAWIVPADPCPGRSEARSDRAAPVRAVTLDLPRICHRVRRETPGHDRSDRSWAGRRTRRSRRGRPAAARSAAQPRGTGREALVQRRRSLRWLDRHGHAEDRGPDLVANQVPELAVQLVGLAAELVERVLLGVTAEPDPPAHVVDLGEVLDPQRIDRPQEDHPLDDGPVGLTDVRLALLELRVRELKEMVRDRLAAADLPQLVLAHALAVQA